MTIQNKLIAAFLGTISLLLLTMVLAVQWSFDQGLLEYVNRQQLQQQERLVQQLQRYYQRYGNWDDIRVHWRSIMDKVLERERKRFRQDRLNKEKSPHLPPSGHKPGRSGGRFRPGLLAADKTLLLGRYEEGFALSEIRVDNQLVGWVTMPPAKKLTNAADLAFRNHQHKALLVVVAVMIVIALLVAIPLARHWTRPLRSIARTTHRLAQGDYQQRLTPHGRDELGQLANDVNALAQTLEDNENARKQWVASVSHELRTPVAILRGEIEAIMDGIRPLDMTSLKSLQQEAEQLTRLIQDLYELTNADLGAMRYRKESFDLTVLLDDTLAVYQTALRDAGVQLHWQAQHSVPVWADGNRLQQVLENILSNTMKYAAADDLYVTLQAEQNTVQLTIEDSGHGVPDDALEKLFDHLYRVEASRNRETGGSGLGLAICKKIIEAHDGNILAFNSQHGGLGIQITLPLFAEHTR